MNADVAPPKAALLRLGGIEIPATVRHSRDGTDVHLKVEARGEQLEDEWYRSTDEGFSIVSVAGEFFEPPLPILRYPMTVGESWEWKGETRSDARSQKAEATVSTAVARRATGGMETAPGVEVRVDVRMSPAPNGVAMHRALVFWIQPHQGVVRREFGGESVREVRR